ncbi:MAG: hypothetical protein Kow00124_05650 [Anaerolineae bacterium]
MRSPLCLIVLVGMLVLLVACTPAPAAEESQPPAAADVLPASTEPPQDVEPVEPQPIGAGPAKAPAAGPPPEPQRIEFEAEDGTPLVATFYPPAAENAPGLLLMHQAGSSRAVWEPYAPLWQGGSAVPGVSFGVLAIDFRGHGESGSGGFEGVRMDARASLALLRTLPGVDPDRIILIGASIGADAAVDECSEGCIAAVPLSAGGYLGLPFNDALAALLAAQNPPVLCVAAREDGRSAATCEEGAAVGLADYRVQIYPGGAHGTFMFDEAYEPPLFDLINSFLSEIIAG